MKVGALLAVAGVGVVAWWVWRKRQPSQSATEALTSAVAGPVQAAGELAAGAWGLISGATSDDADAPGFFDSVFGAFTSTPKPPERTPDKYGN